MQVIPEVAMELVSTRTGEVNRLHKVLEDAGVKLATVATDVMVNRPGSDGGSTLEWRI